MKSSVFGIALVASFLLFGGTERAWAVDWGECQRTEFSKLQPNIVIPACSRIIDAGEANQTDLAIAHYRRGRGYHKGNAASLASIEDLDRAIAEAEANAEANAEGDEKTGLEILHRALSAPTRQIAENSAVDGGVVVARMLESEGNIGYDAARNEYVDLVEAGIVDPTKVIRIALENAVSIASILLLTEATITEIPEEEKIRPGEPEMAM